jgi:uncharacterized integral membrane protein
MTSNRPFTVIAAIIFLLMAAAHVYRLMTDFQVIIGSHSLPQSVSWVAIVVAGGLGVMLLREARG